MDYIFAGCFDEITNMMVEMSTTRILKDSAIKDAKLYTSIMEDMQAKGREISSIQTLKRFSKVVALVNNLDINKYILQFIITRKDIPPFADKDRVDIVRPEKLIFLSEKYSE
ncbi:MAG TPA: hypothetical protein VM802_16425 [Chitinophaga sp.]|uniref:hypothetical protein n=1 Tax=Chitinophaga sp. TaxID=1869181 RepID=UPI002D160AC6|nr:hypothetical protein [Chitinophaga sp.]HVI46463.1 hypothetical protein [Chitinophaga sp.]